MLFHCLQGHAAVKLEHRVLLFFFDPMQIVPFFSKPLHAGEKVLAKCR